VKEMKANFWKEAPLAFVVFSITLGETD